MPLLNDPGVYTMSIRPARFFCKLTTTPDIYTLSLHDALPIVVAADHPFVRRGRAGNACDHVVQRLQAPVGLDAQVHFGGSGADVIGDAKPAAPLLRRHGPAQGGEQRLRVAVRNGQYGNLGDGRRLAHLQPLRVLGGAHTGRERVAGVERHVHHAATLHTVLGAPRTLRVHGALREAVVPGIGVEDAAHRAVLGRDVGLDAAPRP